jgi:hypothetical protein
LLWGSSACSLSGSGEYGGNPKEDITTQFNKVKEVIPK